MNRQASLCTVFVLLVGLSLSAHAQGHRPSGAANQGLTRSPTVLSPSDSGRVSIEARRQEMEARRAAAQARSQEAQRKRQEAEANNRSAEARAEHPPSEKAAAEAVLAEQNAENQELRDGRKDLKEENRGDHLVQWICSASSRLLPDRENHEERLFDKTAEFDRPDESPLRRAGFGRAVTGGVHGSIRGRLRR